MQPVGRMVLNRNPGQLLRRDRAGRVLHGAHRARASTSATIRCSPGASIPTSTRRSRGSAGRTSTRFRSTRRSRRCTTTSATACIGRRSTAAASPTSPTRSAAAVPFQAGAQRLHVVPASRCEEDKVRGKPEKFAEHYNQATLFWNSQTPIEKTHIIRAFRFELTRCRLPAIRERVVSQLVNVDPGSGAALSPTGWASRLPEAQPRACRAGSRSRRSKASQPLSLFARPGDGSIRTRRIAILVAHGVAGAPLHALACRTAASRVPCRASSATSRPGGAR